MEPMAHFLADAINPVFAGLVMAAPFLERPRRRAWPFWAASAAGLGLAVLLAEGGKALTHSGFPSGHETFALACGTALACRDVRWLWVVVPLASVLGWALVEAGYHYPSQVAGALLTGPPAALAAQAIWRRREEFRD
jgi:membrane-associated phospholipid phosphatase